MSSMPLSLGTEEEIAELEEVFAFFDEDRDGKIDAEAFVGAIRSLGYAPTESEAAMFGRVIAARHDGALAFSEFCNVIAGVVAPTLRKKKNPEDDITDAFKTFGDLCREGDKGKISSRDLKFLMTERGDALDAQSFSWMLRVAKPEDGMIEYKDLVEACMRGARG